MKLHSDNLKIRAGVLLVDGYNAFPKVPMVERAFRDTLAAIAERFEKISRDRCTYKNEAYSLAQLSTPRFEALGNKAYRMTGGILLFGKYLIEPGAIVSFDGLEGIMAVNAETTQFVTRAVALRAAWREMKYDTYNATPLTELSPEVMRELVIEPPVLDAETLEENVDADIVMVKYKSVYMPDLVDVAVDSAVRVFLLNVPEVNEVYPASDDEFLQERDYDEFLVEITDRSQPFGYIAVEIMNVSGADPEGPHELYGDDYLDTFGKLFDRENRLEMENHTVEGIVTNLRAIAEGKV